MRILHHTCTVAVAFLAISPALTAQTVNPELYHLSNGVGYNKYLTSTIPNSDGEYTIRLETFVTATVETHVLPTDFVVVMDATGSMQWDHRLSSDPVKDYITKAENDLLPDTDRRKLRCITVDEELGYENYTRFTWYNPDSDLESEALPYGYTSGIYGQRARHNEYTDITGTVCTNDPLIEGQKASPPKFLEEASRWYYNAEDEKYYRILGEHVQGEAYANGHPYDDTNGWNFYNLYYNRVNADGSFKEKVYFHSHNGGINTQLTRPWTTNYPDSIILNVEGSENLIFRPGTRRDALIKGVSDFIDKIAEENGKDQWETGAIKHHLAMVTFEGDHFEFPEAPTTESMTKGAYVKVIQSFVEIDASNKEDVKSTLSTKPAWRNATYPNKGVELAKLLLEERQQTEAYKPLDSSNRIKRNKVVIVFTDGEPNYPSREASPDGWGPINTVYKTLEEGYAIKTPRTTYSGTGINGKIYSIDLSYNTNSANFLKHLSSNYPDGRVQEGQVSGTWSSIRYRETTPTNSGYYIDASSVDLSESFMSIADAATGDNLSSRMVIVDKMSDSFVLPSGDLSGKVKFYTAQCIGTKTISGGTDNPYLAFAAPVLAPSRPTLDHLWVSSGSGDNIQWTDIGSLGNGTLADIDNGISYTISDDKKTITVKGFRYSDLWCGQDIVNNNTRHTVATTDPNYGNQKAGYRGFKLIVEFPIVLEEGVIGGPDIDTNDGSVSGLYDAVNGNPVGKPIIKYPVPEVSIPVNFVIQKAGLAVGESASFTLQRRLASDPSSTYADYVSFFITGDGTTYPAVKLINLDPSYHYRVKETGWSWSYTIDTTVYSTEEGTGASLVRDNPVLFKNVPKTETVKHAEAKATNTLQSTTP